MANCGARRAVWIPDSRTSKKLLVDRILVVFKAVWVKRWGDRECNSVPKRLLTRKVEADLTPEGNWELENLA